MGLQNFQGFVGIADVTLSSTLKIYISSILTNGFIQYHDIILQPSSDQDDFFNVKNNNKFGYDFESNGFKIRCIYADLFKTFLTYKIERIGFSNITPEYLAKKIKENINSNYLFCMEFNDIYQIAKFNIMLEIHSYKIQLGLKYDYINNTLSLITMY